MALEIINFTDLTLDEKKMVLQWRNHESIKRWMYDKNNISLDNHLKYIESLQNARDKQYFVVKRDVVYLGVVDFIHINKIQSCAELGLYVNPFEKVTGIGKILIEVAIKYAFNTLKVKKLTLEVFSDNTRALALYERYNFKEIENNTLQEKKIICMELHNDTR